MFHTICMQQFGWFSERGGIQKWGGPQKRGGSNPGGNCGKPYPKTKPPHIHSIVHHLHVSDMLMKIRHETSLDPIMQVISKYLSHGWPNKIHKVETPVHSYYEIWNESSEYEGLILKGCKIVIPTTLQKRMKQILHNGHLGIEHTKANARGTRYWPNINTDINNMVANCTECQIYWSNLEKATLLQHTVHKKPWIKVATDLFHCFNQNYLILVDYTHRNTLKFANFKTSPVKKSSQKWNQASRDLA